MSFATAILGCLLLVTSCAKKDGASPTLPPMTVAAVGAPYVLKVGDHLDIRFYKTPELNVLDIPIRSDGNVSLELVGDVQAAGLQPSELGHLLTQKYASELTDPRVTVIVRNFGGNVFVAGEVSHPAPVPFSNGMTVIQAIAASGGFLDTAKRDSVILIRQVDGKWQGHRIDLDKVIHATDLSQDVMLQPSDIVHVPKTWIANADVFVDQYVKKLLPVQPPAYAF